MASTPVACTEEAAARRVRAAVERVNLTIVKDIGGWMYVVVFIITVVRIVRLIIVGSRDFQSRDVSMF